MRCDVLAPVIFLGLFVLTCILDEESRIICRQWHFAVLEECFTDNFSKLSVFGTCTSKKLHIDQNYYVIPKFFAYTMPMCKK